MELNRLFEEVLNETCEIKKIIRFLQGEYGGFDYLDDENITTTRQLYYILKNEGLEGLYSDLASKFGLEDY